MSPSDDPSDSLTWPAVERFYHGTRANRHLIALPEHSLLYVKNPKAGSSTLMVWLDRVHTGDLDSPLEHMHRDNRLPTTAEVGRGKVLAMLAGRAFRFSFVRHPVRRLESVYWAKMFRDRAFRRRVADGLGISPDHTVHVSFEEFLEAVERQDPLTEMDRHWRPQHLNLLHPLVTLDHVGRLETFEQDLARITEAVGLDPVPVESRNVSPRTSRESVYAGRPDLVSRVERLYATDMELYGY